MPDSGSEAYMAETIILYSLPQADGLEENEKRKYQTKAYLLC